MTYNDSTDRLVYLYKNGKEVDYASQVAMTGNKRDGTLPLYIGVGYSKTREFNGLIDEVKIWNYALTAEQVRVEYAGGAVRFGQ
jgi:hypothetical protein